MEKFKNKFGYYYFMTYILIKIFNYEKCLRHNK
jgi:hypothetical protein